MTDEQYEGFKRALTPKKMETLITLAELKSVTKTAQETGQSFPNISQTLSRLEETTKFKIFIKRRQTYELSPEGEKLIEKLKLVIEAFETLMPDADR